MTSRKKRGDGPAHPEVEPRWLDAVQNKLFAGPTKAAFKTNQLCQQVQEAVSCALACSTSALLRDVYVVGVEPVRGAALLRVLVCKEPIEHDYHRLNEALCRAQGYLRGEVASSIHRKRAPNLQFAVVPAPEGWLDESAKDVDHA